MTFAIASAASVAILGVVICTIAMFFPQLLQDLIERGDDPPSNSRRTGTSIITTDRVALRLGASAIAAAVVWRVTGWPVAAVAAAIAGMAAPSVQRISATRAESLARTEAVASWIEMLRDTMAGAAGLHEAITTSARVAPQAIREHVNTLAVRSEHRPLTEALRQFAADLDDPIADSVVAALIITVENQAGNLGPILTQIATNAREQAAMRIRVEASRSRTYVTVQFIVGVTVVFAAGLIVFARSYLAPFDLPAGQFVLAVILALFGAAAFGLARLGQPAPTARLFDPSDPIT